MNKIYTRILAISLAFLTCVVLVGCSDLDINGPSIDSDTALVTISMEVPGLSSSSTRAMSDITETTVDYSTIKVLVFEQTSTGEELFSYYADIIKTESQKLTLKVKIDKSQTKYRFVLLANTEPKSIAIGDKKVDVLEQFTFKNSGRWSASKSIPMWSESNAIYIDGNKSLSISLHRALARVDVGLLFKFNNKDPETGQDYTDKDIDKESVYGLKNFKIKSVRVYRTRSTGYVSSIHPLENNEVTKTSIPEGAKYNSESRTEYIEVEKADIDPLKYELGENEFTDKIVREFYIPEAEGNNVDNVPCIVVGGYYNGEAKATYYRADFLPNGNSTPVLRNHRYVFDIKSVSGSGFDTPEEALNGIKSPMEIEVKEWNEVSLNYYMQGDYYMKVSEREIWMNSRAIGADKKVFYEVPYETNLMLSDQNNSADSDIRKEFDLSWKSEETVGLKSPFEVSVDYESNKFIFSAPENYNTDKGNLVDILVVKVENFEFTINVNQKESNLNYTMDCDEVKVSGIYREGIELNYTNYISLQINSDDDLKGKEYEIKTIEENGIYFYAKREFGSPVNGKYEVKLEGHGTPVKNANQDFLREIHVVIVSNSSNITGTVECEATIKVGYKSKKILTIGANAFFRFGYQLEPNTASRAFVDASINFGTDPNSKVIMEKGESGHAFDIQMLTLGQGMVAEWIKYEALEEAIRVFEPDIILTGQAIDYFDQGTFGDTKNIDLLSRFVDAGGVFLMCNEYYPDGNSIDKMVRKIMNKIGENTKVKGQILPIGLDQLFAMQGSEDDMIFNGPFVDMKGKKWGADGHILHGYTGLPDGTITYSSKGGSAVMFRHPSKPFFFMGEGGFIANPQRFIGAHYQGSNVYCPFSINANYEPIARTNYTSKNNETVYNSQIFGNILAWAVDQAEKDPVKYPL